MLVIGLTGGVGSGKTTVANLFAQKNVPLIDTDLIAKALLDDNALVQEKVQTLFGTQNRREIRNQIFKDKNKKKALENLLHPLIRLKVYESLQNLQAPYCIVIIPLLAETGFTAYLHRILVVDSEVQNQLDRTMQRDRISLDQAQAMLAGQKDRQARLDLADDIIINNSDFRHLEQEVEKMDKFYTFLAAKT